MNSTASATRRRRWDEHPYSLAVNVGWALWLLIALVLAGMVHVPIAAWIILGLWFAVNALATTVVFRSLTVPLEPPTTTDSPNVPAGTSLWRDAFRRLRRNQMAMLSLVLLGVMLALCFGQRLVTAFPPDNASDESEQGSWATFVATHLDHTRTHRGESYAPPSRKHWFGTDTLGRDLFARTLYGGSISFLVGIVGAVVSVVIGVIWGAIAGYFGGRLDHTMMRIVDILYGLPFLFLVILIMTLVNGLNLAGGKAQQIHDEAAQLEADGKYDEAETKRSSITPDAETARLVTRFMNPIVVVFVVIGLVSWLTMARITRGQMLSLKEREFVVAARSIGAGNMRIIFRHVVPNLLGPVIVYSTLTIPDIMLAEAFLSFVGLGISEPNCSWGSLASEGLQGINVIKPCWWLMAYPAAALSLSLFCLNFIGDGLRDALDPRSK